MTAVTGLGQDQFVDDYLVPGRPVLVRGGLSGWGVRPPWDLAALAARFADHRVPLYDTLFWLQRFSTFGGYVAAHTGDRVRGVPPYLRWFARQNPRRLPWADAAFAELSREWSMPAWLPREDYVFPRLDRPMDVTLDSLPAKGLFVCGRGGRTRLHVDPWASDACLCQVTGMKRLVMYSPQDRELLTAGTDVLDLDRVDEERFPRWREAVPVFDELLEAGDVAFIPAGWFHAAVAESDSLSITWNFVHASHERRFAHFLEAGGREDETVRYFLTPQGRR